VQNGARARHSRARLGSDALAIGVDGKWHGPFVLSGSGGSFTCAGESATVTRVTGHIDHGMLAGAVAQDRCTKDGCTTSTVDVASLSRGSKDAMPREERDLHATDLDGRLLLVWRSRRGGVRARLAKMDEIASAPDDVLIDDRAGADEGDTTVHELMLLARPRRAALFVRTKLGVHVVRVGDGREVASFPD
jgi:hypothetical protein